MKQNCRTVPIPQQTVVSIVKNWDFIITKNYRYAFNVLKTVNQVESTTLVSNYNYKCNVQIKIMTYILSELVQRRKRATVLHLIEKSVFINQQISKGSLILLLTLQKKLLSRISWAFYRIVENKIFGKRKQSSSQQGDIERHFLVAIYQSSQKIRLIFDLLVRKQYLFAFQRLKRFNKTNSKEKGIVSGVNLKIKVGMLVCALNPIHRVLNIAFQQIKIISAQISIRNQEEIQIQAYKSIVYGLNKQAIEKTQSKEIQPHMIELLEQIVNAIQKRLVRQSFDRLYYQFDKDCTQDTIQVLKQQIEYLQQEIQ